MADRNEDSKIVTISDRIKLGKEWRDNLSHHKRLAKSGHYIRIRGKDFRAVSLNADNPCGRLLYKDGSEVHGHRNISKAIESADHSGGAYGPKNNKTEHKIQAFLIREALLNDLDFHHLFRGFEKIFDRLLFVTDELRLDDGKLRADVISIGRIGGQYFPVLIELKAHRHLTKLIDQLNNAKALLEKDNCVRDLFGKFLCAVSDVVEIDAEKTLRLIIWPGSKSGKEAKDVAVARNTGILVAKYSCNRDGRYNFILDDPSQRMGGETIPD